MNSSPLCTQSDCIGLFVFVEIKCPIPAQNCQLFLCLNSDKCINSWFYCFYLVFFTFAHIYVVVQTRRLVDRVIYSSCTGRQYTRILATVNKNSGRLWKHFFASDKVFTIPYIICVNFGFGTQGFESLYRGTMRGKPFIKGSGSLSFFYSAWWCGGVLWWFILPIIEPLKVVHFWIWQ